MCVLTLNIKEEIYRIYEAREVRITREKGERQRERDTDRQTEMRGKSEVQNVEQKIDKKKQDGLNGKGKRLTGRLVLILLSELPI